MINLKNVVLRRGTKVLLNQAGFTLQPGENAALVGRNGAGKSTLFALLNGTLQEEAGSFSMPPGWRLAQVAQDMPQSDESATDFVLAGDTHLLALQQQLQAAEAAGDGIAMAHAHVELADAGAYDARARAQALILGLGFQPAGLEQPVSSFSGGWRMRLQLARALMAPSDLLLLDEPTNHLDLDALIWLEAWLARYPGTLLVISHDREFLDTVSQVTLHLEQQSITRYGGNYSFFEEQRALSLAQQQTAFARQQDKIAHLQKFIDRFKAKATKARQAQSRVKALERMERIAPVLAEAEFSFEFKAPLALPNPMLAVSAAEMGYKSRAGGEQKTILHDVNLSVQAGQRIGILGANGQGKSTLIKSIVGDIPLISGEITKGKGLAIGYFAQQELDVLHESGNALEHMISLARGYGATPPNPAREQDLRNFLGSFNFSGEMMSQPVGTMSGGEKARLVLAMLVWQRPGLLLLDEPTNHLDLATREALSMALNSFEGTLMLVSHDRALLRAVSDQFWLVSGGRVTEFEGDLEDYQQHVLQQQREARNAATAQTRADTRQPPAAAPAPASSPQTPAGSSNKEQRRQDAQARQQMMRKIQQLKKKLLQLETQISNAQEQKSALEADPDHAGRTPLQWQEYGLKIRQLQESIETAEEQWLTVSEELQALEQD